MVGDPAQYNQITLVVVSSSISDRWWNGVSVEQICVTGNPPVILKCDTDIYMCAGCANFRSRRHERLKSKFLILIQATNFPQSFHL